MIAAARPLVDLIWSRETDAGVFDTPERRAALEARLREIARAIGDESVRRHYAQAFAERIAAFFPAPERARSAGPAGAARYQKRRRSSGANAPDSHRPIPISDRLKRSPMMAGRSGPPLREVVLMMTMINHPGLIATHLDDFAHVEFSHSRDRGAPLGGDRSRRRRRPWRGGRAPPGARRRALCRRSSPGSTRRLPPSGCWPAAPAPAIPTRKRPGCRL